MNFEIAPKALNGFLQARSLAFTQVWILLTCVLYSFIIKNEKYEMEDLKNVLCPFCNPFRYYFNFWSTCPRAYLTENKNF